MSNNTFDGAYQKFAHRPKEDLDLTSRIKYLHTPFLSRTISTYIDDSDGEMMHTIIKYFEEDEDVDNFMERCTHHSNTSWYLFMKKSERKRTTK